MAKNFLGTQTSRREPDTRSPQHKGKPAHATAHQQIGHPKATGKPASVPNRSGSVRNNAPKMN